MSRRKLFAQPEPTVPGTSTPFPGAPTDADLRTFGWAPGKYLVRCDGISADGCKTAFADRVGDKRAISCRFCARWHFHEARAKLREAAGLHGYPNR